MEELGVDWRVILKWVNKCGKERCGLDWIWVMIGTDGGLLTQ